MSNYKVGDVASLFPVPKAVNCDQTLQSLFNEKNCKRKRRNGKEYSRKGSQKGEEKSTDSVISVLENKNSKKAVSPDELVKKGPKKRKRVNQNSSEEIEHTNSKRKSQKKIENTENEVRMENKLSKVEPTVFKTNTKRKKQHKVAMKSSEPAKKEDISIEFNESYNDYDKSNKLSEDLAIMAETKSREKDDHLRTLFVGNLPLSANRKILQKLFCPFGPLKTVRVRGAIPCKINIPKRVAEFTNKYHESVQSHKGFVVFKDRESAEKALSLNGTLLDNHHIVVDFATNAGEKKIYDDKLSIFIGNLPFDVSDETVWSSFGECGKIQAVRIIRDRDSGVGKGFGYILFQDNESKQKALALGKLEINGRKIRIKPIDSNTQKKRGSRESFKAIRKNVAFKKFRDNKSKKSVKKIMKKGRRLHHNKQIARMLGEKLAK